MQSWAFAAKQHKKRNPDSEWGLRLFAANGSSLFSVEWGLLVIAQALVWPIPRGSSSR
jgi:hypothetical protein